MAHFSRNPKHRQGQLETRVCLSLARRYTMHLFVQPYQIRAYLYSGIEYETVETMDTVIVSSIDQARVLLPGHSDHDAQSITAK